MPPLAACEVSAATRDMEVRLEQLRQALVYWRALASNRLFRAFRCLCGRLPALGGG